MADDAYTILLGLEPDGPRPPDHYALLGLPRFCQDRQRIEEQARKQIEWIREAVAQQDASVQQAVPDIIRRISLARAELLDGRRKQRYDKQLATGILAQPSASARSTRPPPPPSTTTGARPRTPRTSSPRNTAAAPPSNAKPSRRRICALLVVFVLAGTSAGWWVYDRLRGQMQAQRTRKAADADVAAWRSALNAGDEADFRQYLADHPDGNFAYDARDELAWKTAQHENTADAYRAYLAAFEPAGRHVPEARKRYAVADTMVADLGAPIAAWAPMLSTSSAAIVLRRETGDTIGIYDLNSGDHVRDIGDGPTDSPVTCLAGSPDGELLAVCHTDQMVRLWEVETGRLLWEKPSHTGSPWVGVAFDRAMSAVVALDRSGFLRMRRIDTGERIRDANVQPASAKITCKAGLFRKASDGDAHPVFHPILATVERKAAADVSVYVFYGYQCGAANLAVACGRGLDRVLSPLDLNAEDCLHGDWDEPRYATVSPDGAVLALATTDLTLVSPKRWSVPRMLKRHRNPISAVAFASDGRLAASGDTGGGVTVWDIDRAAVARTFLGHDQAVTGLTFTDDGTTVLSVSTDGTIRKWDVSKLPRKQTESTEPERP